MAALLERVEDTDVAPQTLAPLVAALDVGVSKTVCLAARRDPVLEMHPERPLRVLGVGQQTAPAIASGKPADFDSCARAIEVAIEEASAMAGAPITRVVASYAGPGMRAEIVRGAMRVKKGVVSGADIENVLNAAMRSIPTPEISFLHVEPLSYSIDDGEPIADPLGHPGKMLSVEACVVTAPTDALNALRACVRQAGAEVEDIIAAPKAAALSVLTAEEREEGVLVIDLGAGSTGVSVFTQDVLVHAETIALGGVRLTRDLAAKLRTTFAAAERVKLHYGAVSGACDPHEAVQAPKLGEDGRLEAATAMRGAITETITPRFTEMLLQVRQQLARAGFTREDGPQRAVLVGGGALTPGVRELAIETLGMPVRIGRPFELCGFDHGDAGPAYAVAAGMLRHRFDTPTLDDVNDSFQPSLAQLGASMRNGVHAMWNWLRDNF